MLSGFWRRHPTSPALCAALVSVSALFLSIFTVGVARAAPSWRVLASGDCPSVEQVSAALDCVFKGERGDGAVVSEGELADLALSVEDLGPQYRVSIAGQTHDYVDARRVCEERAHVAAVFAVMATEPPVVPNRAKPPSTPPIHAHRRLELRAGGLSDIGLRHSGKVVAWGGEIRAAVLGQRWGIELGISGEARTTIAWGRYRAGIIRFPFDLSLRGSLRWAHATVALAIGPAASIFNLRGEGSDLPVHYAGTRLDLGFRSALSLVLLPDARISPFIGVHGSVWPKPYAVEVDEAGQVGTTPRVWVGGTLGIAVAIE